MKIFFPINMSSMLDNQRNLKKASLSQHFSSKDKVNTIWVTEQRQGATTLNKNNSLPFNLGDQNE